MMLLILLATCPNAAASATFSTSESSEQAPLNAAAASSPTQYPWHYCYPWDYSWCYPYYWNYDWWYYPYYYSYYYPTTTTETTKTFELKVETNPPGIVPVTGKGTYNQGTVASFSLTSLIVPLGASERYVFSHWSGDFSGGAPSGSITMDSAKTVVADYQLENYLKVAIDPLGIAGTVGEGWYRSGESVTVGAVPQLVSGGDGVRYVFEHWTIGAVPVSGNPIQLTMDTPHTVVARYKTQYLLTVSSEYGYVDGEGWYDAGSPATFSVTPQVDTGYGVKQVFDRWTGDLQSTSPVVTVTMNSPFTVRAAWRTDSTILYTTIALAVGAAFVLGIGLTAIAIRRHEQAKPVPEIHGKSVTKAEAAPEKLRPARVSKRVKPPKTKSSQGSPEA